MDPSNCHVCRAAAVKLRHPFTAIVAGSTGAGKTVFISNLLRARHSMVHPPVERVIYSYARFQQAYENLTGVEFVKGTDYVLDPSRPTLLIIDDQAGVCDKINVEQLFTVDSHHSNCSVILVTQNLFQDCKSFRTAALNAQYMFLFKSPRGAMQVSHLARQMYPPARARRMVAAYADATKEPFSYLLVDMKSDTEDALRLRTCVLPQEGKQFAGSRLTTCYRI